MAMGARACRMLFSTILPLLISFSTSIKHVQSQTRDSSYYDRCAPFNCGNITFSFPFSSTDTFGGERYDCGLPRFQIACDDSSVPSIVLFGRSYQVKDLYLSDGIITVVDQQLINDIRLGSCNSLRNLSRPATNASAGDDLRLAVGGVNLTIFECPKGATLSGGVVEGIVGNYSCGEGEQAYVWDGTQRDSRQPVETPSGCEFVNLPVSGASLPLLRSNSSSGGGGGAPQLVADALSYGFQLQWPNQTDCANCQQAGKRCGYDGSSGRIVCFCKGGCNKHKSNKWKVIVGIATGSSFGLLAVVFLLIFKYRKRISVIFKRSFSVEIQTKEDERNAKEFIKEYRSTILTNYSYNDIKKMTGGNKEKLGKGGYGSVFKGKLPDGRLVAVKMLQNYKDNNQNFLNEVTTIGRIHHVNVIRLLGFCWDGSKRALIYEYMPYKSLGDLMSKEETSLSLGFPRLLEIAIGVAHGLEYLHNGCDSRILHLDVKPHNVLLDRNLKPKISDFGLAKVYSRNQSAVTMTGARGTIGYIAPEVFLRNLGNPSHKSDVYSFGMLLLEMAGARKHDEPDVNPSSGEAYFPGWIYDKLIEEKEMEIEDDIVAEEVCIMRKMVMVGLWCIQINPRDRPSMIGVVEMLSGNVETIEMPPKPLFFSPPTVQPEEEPFFFSPPGMQLDTENTSIESESSALPLTSSSHDL